MAIAARVWCWCDDVSIVWWWYDNSVELPDIGQDSARCCMLGVIPILRCMLV